MKPRELIDSQPGLFCPVIGLYKALALWEKENFINAEAA